MMHIYRHADLWNLDEAVKLCYYSIFKCKNTHSAKYLLFKWTKTQIIWNYEIVRFSSTLKLALKINQLSLVQNLALWNYSTQPGLALVNFASATAWGLSDVRWRELRPHHCRIRQIHPDPVQFVYKVHLSNQNTSSTIIRKVWTSVKPIVQYWELDLLEYVPHLRSVKNIVEPNEGKSAKIQIALFVEGKGWYINH